MLLQCWSTVLLSKSVLISGLEPCELSLLEQLQADQEAALAIQPLATHMYSMACLTASACMQQLKKPTEHHTADQLSHRIHENLKQNEKRHPIQVTSTNGQQSACSCCSSCCLAATIVYTVRDQAVLQLCLDMHSMNYDSRKLWKQEKAASEHTAMSCRACHMLSLVVTC